MTRPLGQAGQVIPLVAIMLTALMGFGGVVADNGFWQYTQRQQQTAADSAAIGGAQSLAALGCVGNNAGQPAALNDAQTNGYENGSGSITVTVSNPPTTGAYAGNDCAVQVQIQADHPSFFARIFHRDNMWISTTATALLVQNSTTAALSPTPATPVTGSTPAPSGGCTLNGTISAPYGAIICGSGPVTCGSTASITARSIGYSGSANCSSGNFPSGGATPAPTAPVKNPCPEIAGCNTIANNPPPTTGCTALPPGNMDPVLQPGCYSSFPVGSCGTVTLEPGTYVLTGTSDFSNSSFVGTGVTFYVTSSGSPPDFSAANSATMTAPTTGDYTGVLYYQVAANTGNPNFSGSNLHFSGLVYAPGATNLNFSATNNDVPPPVVVAGGFTLTGPMAVASPEPGTSVLPNVVLAQ